MLDGARGPSTIPISDRLDRLRRFTVGWEQLRWTTHIELPHLEGYYLSCGVSDDTLVLSRRGDMDLVPSACVQRFPSDLRAIDERHVTHTVSDSSHLYNLTLNSAQDLLAFRIVTMECVAILSVFICVSELRSSRSSRVHLRSLSTCEAHPLACTDGVVDSAISLARIHDIRGDYLLETGYFEGPFRRPVLRNWKTGLMEAAGPPIYSATPIFLDDRHILTIEPNRRDLGTPACLRVTALVPIELAPPSYLFALPESLQNIVSYVPPSTHTLEAAPVPRSCFVPDPSERLISIVLSDRGSYARFTLDVLTSTFSRYIAAHPAGLVPWDVWGTHGARLSAGVNLGVRWTVCGVCRANVRRRSAADRTAVLTVLDYCPRRVARAPAASVLRGADVGGGLRSLLPCIATEVPFPESFGDGTPAASICENGVLFAKCHPGNGKILEAWAYVI
ncbi:hypothetical protein BV25DRAFT_1916876 [Artomyces pyxidatus]|uniref:Uncharacterized protein n=1 Tax=Artomyces pyxidatus TaxID=48021 RepID=A0ACB8T0L1_9AGAM|nr:hypothetical protein BV25DRAFT_1916876 [Artomyces pyxidatus]